ncbi:MAG TPA: hypothetical protein VL992_08070 [Tepidisphaeraceae bacterium]|nr:hypothetical protein [Tepidisphaeraceae bacterium]
MNELPTVWGLDPIQLLTRYWASLGVQVVRQGEPSQIVSHAEVYLLTDPRSLVLFKLSRVMEVLNWIKPLVVFVRLHDERERSSRHEALTTEDGRFVRFARRADSAETAGLSRVVLTPEIEVARLWQSAPDPVTGWRRLRRFTPRHDRMTLSLPGSVFSRWRRDEIALLGRQLVKTWKRPDAVVARAVRAGDAAWADRTGGVDSEARVIGPVWIGAGRKVDAGATLIGPRILWDEPAARPPTEAIQWLLIEPIAPQAPRQSIWKSAQRVLRNMTRS